MSEQAIVRDLLAQFYDSRADNTLPLGIDMIEQMRGKNGGYPRFLYKDKEQPVQVTNKQQEEALSARGYVRNYRHQAYPATLCRRNATTVKSRIGDSKDFEDLPKFPDFIETIVARDAVHEESLKAARVPKECSPWMNDVTALPDIEDGPSESPEETIARLRGQLEALQADGNIPLPEGALSKQERKQRRQSKPRSKAAAEEPPADNEDAQ